MQIDGKAAAGRSAWSRSSRRAASGSRARPSAGDRAARPRVLAAPRRRSRSARQSSFPNFDTVFHNVFSTSPLGAFDLGLYKVGEAREYTFTKEGIIRLGCNLHANMSAYIAVVVLRRHTSSPTTRARSRSSASRPASTSSARGARSSKAPITQDVTIKAGKNESPSASPPMRRPDRSPTSSVASVVESLSRSAPC